LLVFSEIRCDMKKIFLLLVVMLFVLATISCDKKDNHGETGDTGNTGNDEETDDSCGIGSKDENNEIDDSDCNGDTDTTCDGGCTLSNDWMLPDPDWDSWYYLKMMGRVNEHINAVEPALLIASLVKLAKRGILVHIRDGAYSFFENKILFANGTYYEIIAENLEEGTATVDYYDLMIQFSKQLIPILKEEQIQETDFGALTWFRRYLIDVSFNESGEITNQWIRKSCWYALSATEEFIEEGETYDVPVGGIYGCFCDDNIDGSVGEVLRMMFRGKLTEEDDTLLKYFNTQQDGTVLEPEDDGYTKICTCYDADGKTEIDCSVYEDTDGNENPDSDEESDASE